MIESIESYKNGWESTKNRSEEAFKQFLIREKEFVDFKDNASQFYKHVWCGILHQSETTGGWKIQRKGKIFEDSTKSINATIFLIKMKKTLNSYTNNLISADWDSENWINLRKKLQKVIKNCE
ncbi:hypothetical protein [Aquiflexum sp.]|uniref:hypothetical protein n=1 Tax=Aquiflexum sp. TaxID=1872584 RepID=UPI0035930A41